MFINKTLFPLIACVTILLGFISTSSWAAKHALLIGVSDYHVKPLSGPINDVAAVQKVLVKKWNFRAENIKTVLNKQGTRENILRALRNLYDYSKPGDDIFIYMSGHGTSSNDRDLSIPLPTTSGAFIPIDVNEANKLDELLEKVIIGKRDLQPIFSKLDEGNRNVFVVIDACYSGNTVRGKFSEHSLQTRALSLTELLPNRSFGDDLDLKSNKSWENANTQSNTSFPYKNIYYLSAAGEHEPAQDIPPSMLNIYPTIDGKPHGAFTDSLLRILNKEIDSDTDQDGKISYGELKTSVRNLMRIRGFNHTPQGLPSLADDKGNLSKRSIFGEAENTHLMETVLASKSVTITEATSKISAFTIKVDQNIDTKLRQAIDDLHLVSLVDINPDLNLKMEQEHYLLISKSGDLITRLDQADDKALIELIKTQQKINAFLNQATTQSFGLELDMHDRGKGSTAVNGENIGFTVKSAQDSYLLLLNIDSHGMVTVLYPYYSRELNPVEANNALELKNISKIRPPFGRDIVLAAAFSKMTKTLHSMKRKSFSIHSPQFREFESLLSRTNINHAQAKLVLISAKK